MSVATSSPAPSIVEHIDWLSETLTSRIKPGEPVDDVVFDTMVAHLREFRRFGACVDAELAAFRELQVAAEKRLRANLHGEPKAMQ